MNNLMVEILELAKRCSDTSSLNKFFGKMT